MNRRHFLSLVSAGFASWSLIDSQRKWRVAERIGESKVGRCVEAGDLVILKDVGRGVRIGDRQFIWNEGVQVSYSRRSRHAGFGLDNNGRLFCKYEPEGPISLIANGDVVCSIEEK